MSGFSYRITDLALSDGAVHGIGFLTIIVGPNNSGKSRLLREIAAIIANDGTSDRLMLKDVVETRSGTFSEIASRLKFGTRQDGFSMQMLHMAPKLNSLGTNGYVTASLEASTASAFVSDDSSRASYHSFFGLSLVSHLTTDTRLTLLNAGPSGNPQVATETLLQALLLSPDEECRCNHWIKAQFQTQIRLDPSAMSTLHVRVGQDIALVPEGIRVSGPAFAKYSPIESQGDGLRAFATVLTGTVVPDRPVTLIDEPEAFLHPPQAFALGKALSELADEQHQIIVATHSVDFLRGALSGTIHPTLCRLTRSATGARIALLPEPAVSELAKDPVASASRTLDGLFAVGAIFSEADADRAFYERVAIRINRDSNIFFGSGQGKHSLIKPAAALRSLGVPVALIVDIDIIRDANDLKRLCESLGADTATIDKILAEREDFIAAVSLPPDEQRFANVKAVLEAQVPTIIAEPNPRSGLAAVNRMTDKIASERDAWKGLKGGETSSLPAAAKDALKSLLESCEAIRLLIVPVGELEYWLKDEGLAPNRDKAQWILQALPIANRLEPTKGGVWGFVRRAADTVAPTSDLGL